MEFRILGPLEVRDAGRALPLGGQKQRALLAILLLRANDLVSADRLIDELWGEEPPETARNVIQVYVSQVRKVLAAGSGSGERATLETRQPGYVLHVAPEDFDLSRVDRLAERGRSALVDGNVEVAARSLEDALALWRGEPLADFQLEPFAQREIARLEELRLSLREDRFEVYLDLGRGPELIAELEALTAEHPLRERLHGQLMQALYQAGRQAEALEAYGAVNVRLTEELGVDPGPALQHLQAAILRQDASLSLAAEPAEATPTLSPGERQNVTILAATTTTDDRFIRIVEAAGGKTLEGEAADVATFGYDERHDDDAERAATAALALIAIPVGRGVGIASGRVGADRADPDALRSLVARATSLATRSDIVALDPNTARRLRSQFSVRGLDGEATLVAGQGADADIPSSPFVGRQRELDAIAEVLSDLRSGRGQVLLVEGETGMGKTRTLWEAKAIAGREVAWLQGSCVQGWAARPYLALSSAIRRFVGTDEHAEGEDVRGRLAAVLGRGDALAILDPLAPLFGAGIDREPSDRLTSGFRQLIESLASRVPVVLAIDDTHEIDEATRSVVADLMDLTESLPVGLVLAGRADPASRGWPLWIRAESSFRHRLRRVELTRLDPDAASQLADALSPTGALDHRTRDDIVDRAEGNPLFLEELTAALVEGNGLERSTGWTLSLTTAGALLPPRLEDLLALRIQRLPAEARRLAQAVAVVGDDVPRRLAGRVAEVDEPDGSITLLLRSQVLREAGRSPDLRMRFYHGLLRDAALTTLTPERAREMYARAADEIGSDPIDDIERLAFYLYRAGRWSEALDALQTFAEELERNGPVQAIEIWDLAARAADHLDDREAAAAARSRAEHLRSPDYRGQNWRPESPARG